MATLESWGSVLGKFDLDLGSLHGCGWLEGWGVWCPTAQHRDLTFNFI